MSLNILLVEDHPIFRFGVRHLVLQRWPDANVGEAESMQAALTALEKAEWDIAVLDLNLPDARQLMRLGAQGYLTKEHATEELISAIERLEKGGRYISHSMAEHMAQSMLDDSALPAHEQLGKQEYRVMLQIAIGTRVTDIASTMNLSPKTVSTYRTRIFEKLGVNSNVELAHYCLTHHLSEAKL